MQTDSQPTSGFLQTVCASVARLKTDLQRDYERAYPDLSEIVHLIIAEEEAKAWELFPFPHLVLPDLVDAHVRKLGLEPADTRHEYVIDRLAA